MDCPRCRFPTPAERSHCSFCGWQLSRAFSKPPASTASAARPTSPAPASAAESFVFAPASALPTGRAPVGTPLAPSSQSPADAFVLVAPDVAIRNLRNAPTRRPSRRLTTRGANWLRRLPRHSSAAIALALDSDGEGPEPKPDTPRHTPPRLEVIREPLVQTAFDFTAADEAAEPLPARASAPLDVRARAGLFDALLIVLASTLFFGLFAVLGGQLSLGRRDLLIYLLASFVLAVIYFSLFTLFGGRTPGMQSYGLHVVGFDGKPASPRRAAWRAFGYVVSIGSLFLGYLWALFDDRHLTWHDYLSQTFLTDRPPQ